MSGGYPDSQRSNYLQFPGSLDNSDVVTRDYVHLDATCSNLKIVRLSCHATELFKSDVARKTHLSSAPSGEIH